MVYLVDLCLSRHPAVFAVERHRNFGFQIPLPLFLPLRRQCHNNASVSKHKNYGKTWDVVLDTTFGTIMLLSLRCKQ